MNKYTVFEELGIDINKLFSNSGTKYSGKYSKEVDEEVVPVNRAIEIIIDMQLDGVPRQILDKKVVNGYRKLNASKSFWQRIIDHSEEKAKKSCEVFMEINILQKLNLPKSGVVSLNEHISDILVLAYLLKNKGIEDCHFIDVAVDVIVNGNIPVNIIKKNGREVMIIA